MRKKGSMTSIKGKDQLIFSSGRTIDVAKLSPAGQVLARNREEVIKKWMERVRSELTSAQNLAQPVLVNTLPAYIDNLAEALSPDVTRLDAIEFTNLAEEHGSERARLTVYDPDDLIREYQLFKDVLYECLEREITISREEHLIINRSIDAGLREAAVTFALVQSGIREQFVATLTHDLRNPISVIKMAAEIVLSDCKNEPEADTMLRRIVENAKRADRMIRDLLDATVVKTGGRLNLDLALCDIMKIMTEVADELNLAHDNRFKTVGESLQGYWCEDALRRALENLCMNAVKYGSSNTPIIIQVKATHGRMILSVHNEGPPIPTEEQESIFQAFRRAHASKKNKQAGWGIGLALARGVTESHGGSLGVDSKEGRGTTFIIDIPVDARPFQDVPVTG